MIETLVSPFQSFLTVNDRLYWLYILSSITIAYFLYVSYKTKHAELSLSPFAFLFPKKVILHPSAINDYFFFYANTLFQAMFLGIFFSSTSIIISDHIQNLLAASLLHYKGIFSDIAYKDVIIVVILTLIGDFALFISHYCQHKIPFLWEFHKVHHSAEVMTPLTVYRMHPIDNIFTANTIGILNGLALGIICFFIGGNFNFVNIAGSSLVLILFYLLGYNLRHSHIWLSYGPFFSKLLISPAQHQIHHSANPTHFDKNLGFIFAIWDALFRSLYIPKQREILTFGLGGHENKKFSSFWSLYLMPFKNLASSFRLSMFLEPKRYLSVLVFLSIVFPSVYLNLQSSKPLEAPEHVFMEEMTWKEIHKAISSGTKTVLIPTGGTEQNGPHMVLGKHNYIVKYTTGRIAEQLGNALVAPILTYVPEGTITPPDGHMRFSGTLSVSDKVFSKTLEFIARSLKQHGFKTIAFVGDSGGNQQMQALVAAKLNALWQKADTRVLHIDDYYSENQQTEYLSSHGFSAKQIGSHAGIRDTSELMAVFPEGIRSPLLQNYSESFFLETGANGDSGKASAVLGRSLLKLKINAAVKQIRENSH